MKIWLCLMLVIVCKAIEEYGENLKLEKIGEKDLKAEFRFWSWRESKEKDFEVFPRILDELIEEYDIRYLMVIMGQGRWKDEWGMRTQPSSIHGAQVYAVFGAENEQRADKKLQFLIEALNGILCTSLSQISLITSPELRVFHHPNQSKNVYRRYGVLSGETTCTENLTRLRKLLACRQSGISTLLHPSKLYDVMYHSSHLIVQKSLIVEMEVGVTVVVKNTNSEVSTWRLSEVFGKHLNTRCEVAKESKIEMNSQIYNMLNNSEPFDIDLSAQPIHVPETASLVRAWTSQGGSDQQNGILHLNIQNGDKDSKIEVSQILPYFIQPRYSKIIFKNCQVKRKAMKTTKEEKNSVLLQYEIDLKSGMKCEISIPFDKKLLRLDDYPPDANHGMNIPAAVIYVIQSGGNQDDIYTIHTNTILVALPVPDFSMPFNVICFVATAFALIFGPLQLYSTMWLAPTRPTSTIWRKINRLILLSLILLCLYAHFMEINLNEVRRGIEKYLEKLNELR